MSKLKKLLEFISCVIFIVCMILFILAFFTNVLGPKTTMLNNSASLK